MLDNISTARQAAINLIANSVERGDSLECLKASFLDNSSLSYSASIGGYVNQKWVSTNFIVVTELQGNKIEPKIFELKELYLTLKSQFMAGSFISTNPLLIPSTVRNHVHVQQSLF